MGEVLEDFKEVTTQYVEDIRKVYNHAQNQIAKVDEEIKDDVVRAAWAEVKTVISTHFDEMMRLTGIYIEDLTELAEGEEPEPTEK